MMSENANNEANSLLNEMRNEMRSEISDHRYEPQGIWASLLGLTKKKTIPHSIGKESSPKAGPLRPDTGNDMVKAILNPLWIKLLVIGVILYYLVTNFPDFKPFPEVTAFLVAKILGVLNINAVSWGQLLLVERLPGLEVSAECSGVVLMMIFPLTIFLIPSVHLNHRLASLLFIPLLFFGNILRITVDVLIGLYYNPDMILFFHDTLGQVFIFFWAIGMYLIWLRLFNNFPKEKVPTVSNAMRRKEDDL